MALGAATACEQVDGMLIVVFETPTFFYEQADAAPGGARRQDGTGARPTQRGASTVTLALGRYSTSGPCSQADVPGLAAGAGRTPGARPAQPCLMRA